MLKSKPSKKNIFCKTYFKFLIILLTYDSLYSYPLGESFEDEALDGRFCSVLMVLECPDKLVTHQTSLDIDPPVNTVVSRKFSADKMIMTLQCQGVTATAEFKRV